MPKDSHIKTKVKESTALTIFPLSGGKIFYYHGDFDDALKTLAYGFSTFSYSDGIGQVIRNKKAGLERQEKDLSKELFLIMKPTDGSSYSQLIKIMDEVEINDLRHYAIADISEAEKELIIKLNGSL